MYVCGGRRVWGSLSSHVLYCMACQALSSFFSEARRPLGAMFGDKISSNTCVCVYIYICTGVCVCVCVCTGVCVWGGGGRAAFTSVLSIKVAVG